MKNEKGKKIAGKRLTLVLRQKYILFITLSSAVWMSIPSEACFININNIGGEKLFL